MADGTVASHDAPQVTQSLPCPPREGPGPFDGRRPPTREERDAPEHRRIDKDKLARFLAALDQLATIDEVFAVANGINPKGKGRRFVRSTRNGRVYVRRYVVPRDADTPVQRAQPGRFAEAVAAWRTLSDYERGAYNEAAKDLPLTGYNLFVREFLNGRGRGNGSRTSAGGTPE